MARLKTPRVLSLAPYLASPSAARAGAGERAHSFYESRVHVMEAMKSFVEQGGTVGVCLVSPPTPGPDEVVVEFDQVRIAIQISHAHEVLCADAVRAALGDLMAQPRSPESISDS